jgi:hypothetical protein
MSLPVPPVNRPDSPDARSWMARLEATTILSRLLISYRIVSMAVAEQFETVLLRW